MNRFLKIALTLALVFYFSAVAAEAGDAGRESHFSLGSGARALGMGGGFVGLADDASTIYWNQAGLQFLEYQEIDFTHVSLLDFPNGAMYDVVSYVNPYSRLGGFGVSFMNLRTGDIIRRVDWIEHDTFGFNTWQLILGYGKRVSGDIAFGGALKIINQSLDSNHTYGAALDFSALWKTGEHISAGLIIQNFPATKLKLDRSSEKTPATVMIGGSYRNYVVSEDMIGSISLALEKTEDRSVKVRVGVESLLRERLAFRVGLDRGHPTFGAGYRLYEERLQVDYALCILEGINDSHRLGISYQIGPSVSERSQRDSVLENVQGSYLILDDRQRQFDYYKEIADDYNRAGRFDSAYAYYQRALAYRDDFAVRDSVNQLDFKKERLSETQERQSLLAGYYREAENLLSMNLFEACLELANRALAIDPRDERFISLKARVDAARDDEIERLLDEAQVAEEARDLSRAVILYNRILEMSPNDVTAARLKSRMTQAIDIARIITQGVEAYYRGELDRAESMFIEVTKAEPDNMVAQEYLGIIARLRQQPDEQQRLQDDEEYWGRYLEGMEYYQNGNYEEAIRLWEQVLQRYPNNEQTLENINQARLRLESGQ